MTERFQSQAFSFGHLFALFSLLAAGEFLQAAGSREAPTNAPLVVVSDDNYPPYIFREASGELRGILPDQWALWERKTGIPVELKAMEWSKAQQLMREGRADVIDTLFFNEERAKRLVFTPPYAQIEVPVYAHKTLGGISDISSLKGFTVGVKAGDNAVDFLKSHGIDSLKEYASFEALILAAKSQEIKVFTVDQPAAAYLLYKHGLSADFRHSFILYTGELHRAVSNGRADLLRQIQSGFAKISPSELRAIDRKWLGTPFLSRDLLQQGMPWLLGGLAALLALLAGNILLGRRVHTKTSALSAALEELRQSLAERQQTEEALRENVELFSLFLRHSPIYIFVKEVTATASRVVMASENFQEMVGVPGSQMSGKTMEELFPHEFAVKISDDDRAVVAKKEVLKLDENLNGRHYTSIKFPIFRGGKTLLAGFTIDITERKRTEQALALALERYELLAKQNKIITWEIAPDGLYIDLGAQLGEITRLRPEDLIGKMRFYELHPPEGRERFKEHVLDLVRRGAPMQNLVHPVMLESGAVSWFTSSGIPTRDAQGLIRSYWGTSTDITDRKRAEQERESLQEKLTHAQKLESVGRLAGGVAHDFNNMLQAILSYTEMALEQVPAGQPLRDDLLEIQKAAERSAKLTRQLQTFARKQVVSPKALNINEAVSGMSDMLRRLIGKDIRLDWKPGPGAGAVMIDPGQFDQILVNLCINARDAIALTGNIAIETAHAEVTSANAGLFAGFSPGAYALLSVRDNGAGMPQEVVDRIFEPFFTTKHTGQGTGLGLSIVYGIVAQNGGHIRVESVPGAGSCFQIFLPCCAAPEPAPEPAAETAEPPAPTATGTILLVDDEESILRPTRRTLERLGFRVLATVSAREALRLFEAEGKPVDLLITDVIMPDMSGPDLVRELLQRQPGLKHLFISGHTANLLSGTGLGAPPADCIQKPFSHAALAEKVREILWGL